MRITLKFAMHVHVHKMKYQRHIVSIGLSCRSVQLLSIYRMTKDIATWNMAILMAFLNFKPSHACVCHKLHKQTHHHTGSHTHTKPHCQWTGLLKFIRPWPHLPHFYMGRTPSQSTNCQVSIATNRLMVNTCTNWLPIPKTNSFCRHHLHTHVPTTSCSWPCDIQYIPVPSWGMEDSCCCSCCSHIMLHMHIPTEHDLCVKG